ncbi:DUF1740-domain-containing protein [Melanomma pulvis-pyrius CBS 109.77]|uniref:DUF1740-domain-containing protein n=1 Tax=Melanomma pulvis-pyrius CBS 109.77 TaxID=1314802 RepID=A0A6A6WUX9_9PLEO|nr:DUF1740-domain-containing protein [Melanomma pulvis-pyrius CBS 109.77]
MASNIPKFTSFRPKPKAPTKIPTPAEPSKAPKAENSSRKSEKLPKSSNEKVAGLTSDKRTQVPEKEKQNSYIVDRKGDISILTYGSLNRYSIPAYRRYGYGYILGVPSSMRIDRDHSTDQELVLTPVTNRRRERLLTSKHVGREDARSLRFVRSSGDSQTAQDLDYITFSSSRKRKRDADTESHNVDYRSIERKSESVEPSDPDTKYESGTELDDTNSTVTEKNSLLTRKTRDHPHDLEAWLDLVDHQEELMILGRSSFELNVSDKRHLADVKISIYEQALRKIGSDLDSQIKLHVGLMTEASLSWDDAKLSSKWTEVLAKFSSSLELWTRYLDFVETSFITFKYENCRAIFQRCLKALQSVDAVLPEAYLYVMVRLTSMIQQAGYQELALAIWQALLEFNLLSPTEGVGGRAGGASLGLFEEFWDSEVARIGEPDAKGWRAFSADEDIPPVTGPQAVAPADHSDQAFDFFHKRELEHIADLRYPGRMTDEVGEDDPFHLILFSDIEEFLNVLPQDTHGLLILEAFLCFCRLPPLPRIGLHQQSWWMDPFLRHENTNTRARSEQLTSFTQSLVKFQDCPVHHFQVTIEILFDHAFSESSGPIEIAFVRRVLKLLVADSTSDEVIGEYLLALELRYFPTEAFKTAKQLLKARPTSLRIYNAYGLVESRRGNSSKADHVFGAALSMQKGATPLSTPGSLQLFNSWVWEALRRGDQTEALWRLISPRGEVAKRQEGDSENPDTTTLLRGRSILTNANERALLSQDYFSATLCTSLLAFLSYLSSGQKPESGLQIHEKLSVWFSKHTLSQSPMAELHAQSIAQFLTYHATNAPIVKPSLLRTILEPLITRFSSNTILLSLYAANEARFSVDDRVRGIMNQKVLHSEKGSSIVGWFFAIYFEMSRGEIAGSTSHSVRALFKKAEDDIGAHSPALWRRHVLFELDELRKEREKRPSNKPRKDGKKSKGNSLLEDSVKRVKDTFFQGLTNLPWCKEYMMLAFTHLRKEVLTREEMMKVYNVMLEKELRIYVDLNAGAS